MSKASQEGYDAFWDDEDLADNPYCRISNSIAHEEWRRGWFLAGHEVSMETSK